MICSPKRREKRRLPDSRCQPRRYVRKLKTLSALPIRSARLSGSRLDRSGRVAPQNLLAEHFNAGSRPRHFIHKPLDSFGEFLIPRRRQHQRDISPAPVDGAAGRQQHFFAGIRRQMPIVSQVAVVGLRTLVQVGRFVFGILLRAVDRIGQEGPGLTPNGALRRIRSNAEFAQTRRIVSAKRAALAF